MSHLAPAPLLADTTGALREPQAAALARGLAAEHLGRVLDVCVFASLHRDEGRPVVFDLALTRRAPLEPMRIEALAFADPLPFDVEHLAKLALATVPDQSAIAVAPIAGELRIWGVLQLPARLDDTELLLVRARAPGVLAVELAGEPLLHYARGRARLATPGSAAQAIARLVEPHVPMASLRTLARDIRAMGRGGALFVFLDDDCSLEGFDEIRYRVDGGATEAIPRSALTQPAPRDDAFAFVSRLTSVDGAVLLTRDLSILAFGAFVRSPPTAAPLQLIDAHGRPQAMSTLKGARHKSALWFCRAHSPALALVVSHDGDASIYLRLGAADQVVVERDLDL